MKGPGTDDRRRRPATSGSGWRPAGPGASSSALAVVLAGLVALGAGWWVRKQPPTGVQEPVKAATGWAADCVPGGQWVVQPGDTLWGVARRCLGDERDTRYWVELLQDYNGLARGATLRPGQVLRIPPPGPGGPTPWGPADGATGRGQ